MAFVGSSVIAALPIASWWLSHAADNLRTEINAHGIPVALMVEDTDDPFDDTTYDRSDNHDCDDGCRAGLPDLLRLLHDGHRRAERVAHN